MTFKRANLQEFFLFYFFSWYIYVYFFCFLCFLARFRLSVDYVLWPAHCLAKVKQYETKQMWQNLCVVWMRACFKVTCSLICLPSGIFPYTGYIGMSCSEEYGFPAVLVINRVWFLHSSHLMVMFLTSHSFIIYRKENQQTSLTNYVYGNSTLARTRELIMQVWNRVLI